MILRSYSFFCCICYYYLPQQDWKIPIYNKYLFIIHCEFLLAITPTKNHQCYPPTQREEIINSKPHTITPFLLLSNWSGSNGAVISYSSDPETVALTSPYSLLLWFSVLLPSLPCLLQLPTSHSLPSKFLCTTITLTCIFRIYCAAWQGPLPFLIFPSPTLQPKFNFFFSRSLSLFSSLIFSCAYLLPSSSSFRVFWSSLFKVSISFLRAVVYYRHWGG